MGAITKQEDTGIVLINRNLCSGCGNCLRECPWNMPSIADDMQEPIKDTGWAVAHPAQKCDLCVARLLVGNNPACMDACLVRAIDIAPLDVLDSRYTGTTKTALGFTTAETNPSVRFKSK